MGRAVEEGGGGGGGGVEHAAAVVSAASSEGLQDTSWRQCLYFSTSKVSVCTSKASKQLPLLLPRDCCRQVLTLLALLVQK